MERCSACGAALAGDWCGQCFAPRSAPGAVAVAVAVAPTSFRAVSSTPAPAPLTRATRWGKTPTTFGPLGRLVATFALLVPLALMVVGGMADPFVWGGAGVWLLVVMPWALRDIWKAGRVRVL